MSDYGTFKFGGVTYPLAASPFVASKTALDPVLSAAMAFYKAMLERHLGEYFAAMVTDAGATNLSAAIVAEMVAYDPTPHLQDAQYKFPLLAMYRTEETVKDHTVAWHKSEAKFVLLYVLPPLTAAQANRIVHILKGVRAVITDRTTQGYDPAYLGGAEVWEGCGAAEIGVTEVRYGAIPNVTTNLSFPALEMTIECMEIEGESPGLDDFNGLDAKIDESQGVTNDGITVAEIDWTSS